MGEFRAVCREDQVPEGDGKTVAVGQKLIAIFKLGGELFAIDDTCPHMGASLSGGHVADDGTVTCPWHAWRFRLADGAWADNPRIKIGCYPVRTQNGMVEIELSEKSP
jgi:nitrite reductase (NADH) small subunit/3-phenylpropionate/trans-cinnamate dioxygenase ferredoxin subunit